MSSHHLTLFRKIWSVKWLLRSLPSTIYFNFRCLPFHQAVKLPIWLYKPRFGSLKGKIKIDADTIRPGMIRMGYFCVGLYSNNGIYISNDGEMQFKGTALIGNDCYIGIGKTGKVVFGNNFRATTTFRLTSFCGITFGNNVRFGWDCLISDTDFHKMRKADGSFSKGYAPIKIGHNNWIANGCTILKRTETPCYCTISSGTTISSKIEVPEYSIIGSKQNIEVLATGMWLDPTDEQIIYE